MVDRRLVMRLVLISRKEWRDSQAASGSIRLGIVSLTLQIVDGAAGADASSPDRLDSPGQF
jgi:hypothetical protein